jgi:cysteine synthase A
MNPYENILGMIGQTRMVRAKGMEPEGGAEIYAKLEGDNPGGSVKDRIALSMVEAAERDGALAPGGTMLEPTSGNTGIGLALMAALKGYRLILTMPDSMSQERRQMFQAFGAELRLSEGAKGMKGAIALADELKAASPEYFMPQQFDNPANPEVHRRTTALEILEDMGGAPDAFVAGVGTGGTITGVGEVLKQKSSDVRIVAVEPDSSPVLSGGNPGPHKIAGIGAGFAPNVLNLKIFDEIVRVTDMEAAETARQAALRDGIFCGISSGGALFAAQKIARDLGPGKRVVVVLPDRGEKYLSTGLFTPESS